MSSVHLMHLLESTNWGTDEPLVRRFLGSPYASCCEDALKKLRWDALYSSDTHGADHIVRTIFHGAIGAMEEHLLLADTMLLLEACSYHDVGRINDLEDTEHGRRSAQQLDFLTEREGEELSELCAAVDAHARNDSCIPRMLDYYHVQNRHRGTLLAKLLKDADGLDRVRLNDLDQSYLRFPHSKTRVHFAKGLYSAMVAIS